MTSQHVRPFRRSDARIPSRRFPPTLVSVGAVRRMVRETLGAVESECRDAVVLIASELAANAVLHAGTPYVVELSLATPSGSKSPTPVRRARSYGLCGGPSISTADGG